MKSLKITTLLTAAMLGGSLVSGHAAVSISTKPTQNMSCSGGVCTPTAKKAVLNVSDLASMLASGDVKVSSGSLAQNIEIVAAFSWTSTNRLTLESYRSITFKKPVVVAGTGALTITTNDNGSGGDFQFVDKGRVEFWDTSSSLIINGLTYTLVKSIRQIAKAAHTNGVAIAVARDIGAGRKVYTSAPVVELSGILEGLGNTISNLTINSDNDGYYLGLIRIYDRSRATDSIRDIRLAKAKIVGTAFGQQAGVLVGLLHSGAVVNSSATGSVTLSGIQSVAGGLVGYNVAAIVNSHSEALVSAADNGSAGGLVGTNYQLSAIIKTSYTTGDVSGGEGANVGGLVGDNVGAPISNSYATGVVTGGNNALVGGLIGKNEDGNIAPSVGQTYSIGAVSGGSEAILGGLIGRDIEDSSNIYAYWDLDTSGISNPGQGAGNIENDPGITGLTDAQLKSGLPVGFNPAVWSEDSNVNDGYPYLIANPPQ